MKIISIIIIIFVGETFLLLILVVVVVMCVCVCKGGGDQSHHFQRDHSKKTSRGIPILRILFLTRILQSTGKLGFPDGTHKHTDRKKTDIAT